MQLMVENPNPVDQARSFDPPFLNRHLINIPGSEDFGFQFYLPWAMVLVSTLLEKRALQAVHNS